ncbi:MAG: CAP domain-containing protein [Erysipelotrichaceae bacterium]|nr:CAP domain-containing protein [Erysipelotrichaceae bacterium]MDY5252517.1 CAP domain-containing protein [Erysipelotrichaceae bacterium]
MKLTKLAGYILVTLMTLSITTLTPKAEVVHHDTEKMIQTIEVEVNSIENVDLIKTSILHNMDNIDINHVDINNTTLTVDKIDTSVVGDNIVNASINIKSNPSSLAVIENSQNMQINLKVVDTTAPVVQATSDNIVVTKDSEFNPWDYLEYTYDNSAVYPDVTITHNVDTATLGSYEMTITSKDQSANVTEVKVPVTVSPTSVDISNVVYTGDDIQYMLDLINEQRAANGLHALALGDDLAQQAAAIRAQESIGNTSHVRPDGSHYKTAFDELGVAYNNHPLEILTYAGSTVEDKLNWWLNSSGHRAILMDANAANIAIANAQGMWCALVY